MKINLKKRALFAGVLIGLISVLSVQVHAQIVRERKNVDDLTAAEIAVLEAALKAIKLLPDGNPNSYGYLRDTHDGLNGPCEHGSEAFLPWHRELLVRFEKALQQSGVEGAENIMLPYWDWSLPPSGQRYPKIAEDPNSGFYMNNRNKPGGDPLPLATLATGMASKDWKVFGGLPIKDGGGQAGALERPTHNYMHTSYVGGELEFTNTAAIDPIFWLFHNGLDYFWWKWQNEHSGEVAADPTYQLRGFGGVTTADVWDTEKLGYTFTVKQTKTLLDQGLVMKAQSEALEAMQKIDSRDFGVVIPKPGFDKAELLISSVKMAGAVSHTIYYYLHPADVKFSKDSPEQRQKFLAGMDSHFGSNPKTAEMHMKGNMKESKEAVAMHSHHPEKGDVRVNITAAMKAAAMKHAGERWVFTTVFKGGVDPKTERAVPLIVGRDFNQGSIYLILNEER